MLIAFEGPDKTGKSTSAAKLDHTGLARYNMNTDTYRQAKKSDGQEMGLVFAFDRIDWMTHQVYRLAMPGHEWNDSRVRTVFAAPDTHLVIKVHREDMAAKIEDELYEVGQITEVNQMYLWWTNYIMGVNSLKGYTLFKSVTLMEVVNDPVDKTFSQRIIMHDSAGLDLDTVGSKLVRDEETLLELLSYAEQHSL